VQLHDGLQIIEDYAFYECPSLLRIAIPPTVETLGDSAFNSCTRLAEVILKPGRLKYLPEMPFAFCSNFESISIPSTIESIQRSAFVGCNLKSVELHLAADIEIEAHSFGGNEQLCNLSSKDNANARISAHFVLHMMGMTKISS
jgi:hypothetical protein